MSVCVCVCERERERHTRSQHNDRGDDQGADDQDDQQSDGYAFPVPLWWRAANQVLQNKFPSDVSDKMSVWMKNKIICLHWLCNKEQTSEICGCEMFDPMEGASRW